MSPVYSVTYVPGLDHLTLSPLGRGGARRRRLPLTFPPPARGRGRGRAGRLGRHLPAGAWTTGSRPYSVPKTYSQPVTVWPSSFSIETVAVT